MRWSSSTIVQAVSYFFCGLDTHQKRSLCPAHIVSCHICGKRGHFARFYWSKGSSNDVASVAITAPVPSVHRPFLASAPVSLGSAVVPGTLNDSPVQGLIDSGASENFVDFGVCHWLNLPVAGDRSSIGMAWSEISVETFGKTTADLNFLDRTYPSSNFRVLMNLCADVIVGQAFLRQHSSVTFMMNGHKALTIATSAKSPDAGHPAVAAADLEPPRLFEFLLPDCKPIAAPSRRYSLEDTKFIRSEVQHDWMRILSNQPGLPGERKFLLWSKVKRKGWSFCYY